MYKKTKKKKRKRKNIKTNHIANVCVCCLYEKYNAIVQPSEKLLPI